MTDSINALTAYANETTGAEDTTLSDAVHTLVNGYGGYGATANAIKKKLEKERRSSAAMRPDVSDTRCKDSCQRRRLNARYSHRQQ